MSWLAAFVWVVLHPRKSQPEWSRARREVEFMRRIEDRQREQGR